ncbi:MAG: hypothetical protein Q3962_02700 [Corynebacterium sp.]|nr:hypothetical protein [Corynebacterium sp.]
MYPQQAAETDEFLKRIDEQKEKFAESFVVIFLPVEYLRLADGPIPSYKEALDLIDSALIDKAYAYKQSTSRLWDDLNTVCPEKPNNRYFVERGYAMIPEYVEASGLAIDPINREEADRCRPLVFSISRCP